MRKYMVRAAFGAIGGLFIVGTTVPACADPLTVPLTVGDNYLGGLNTYNGSDIIGTNLFQISSATFSRSADNNTLTIAIQTNFAGAANTGPADGTGYGALFFSTASNPVAYNPTPPAPYPNDIYKPNEWNYAFVMPQAPAGQQVQGSTITGNSGLYAIGGGATAVPYGPNPAVPVAYKTANGTITMSNVNTDPVTYPGADHPGFYFRQGQAVQYTPDVGKTADFSGTWSVTATTWTTNPTSNGDGVVGTQGSISFSILDNDLLGDNFAVAWAITCGNDVYQTLLDFGPAGAPQSPTPLPAAALLMGSVLGAGGFMARWRRRKSKADMAA